MFKKRKTQQERLVPARLGSARSSSPVNTLQARPESGTCSRLLRRPGQSKCQSGLGSSFLIEMLSPVLRCVTAGKFWLDCPGHEATQKRSTLCNS